MDWTRGSLLSVAVACAACGLRSSPPPRAATSPAHAPPAPAPAAASSAAAPGSPGPNAGFPAGVRDIHAWPDGTRIGVVPGAYGGVAVYVVRAGASTAVEIDHSLDEASATAWVDVDDDGSPELLVWHGDDPSVYGIHEGDVGLRRRISELLRGAATVDAVRARAGKLRGYVAPAEGVTARDVVLSLRYATDDQVRALVAPKGVSFCRTRTGNALPHMHKCRTVLPSKLTREDMYELRASMAVEDYPGESVVIDGHVVGEWPLLMPDCTETGCSVNAGGPGYTAWDFTGSGASLRLKTLDYVAFEGA